jgi:environmental stress-induced protein Ves
MRWKNGGGETTEIVVSPAGAGLDDFDWRVSTARVASDSPFSRFPGVDRTLAILAGEGLRLSIEGHAPITLTPRTTPLFFAADVNVDAGLLDGPIVDLNVMTRRNRFSHRVKHFEFAASAIFQAKGAESALYCFKGDLRVETPEGMTDLGPGDTLLGAQLGTWRLTSDAKASGYLIEFFDLETAGS